VTGQGPHLVLTPSLVLFYVNFSTFNFRQNLKRFRFSTFKMIIAHWSYSTIPTFGKVAPGAMDGLIAPIALLVATD
jgi:hypothetical protein